MQWDRRYLKDEGEAAKVSVDGTDFRTRELLTNRMFDKSRYSHKFHGPGLRYEIAIAIKICNIVHINGPFKCGKHTDLNIARSLLHNKLDDGEFYIADSGYRDLEGPSVVKDDVESFAEQRKMEIIRAKHETINQNSSTSLCTWE